MSSLNEVTIGDRFSRYGDTYEITAIDGEEIRYSNVAGGKIHFIETNDYKELVESESISIIKQNNTIDNLPHNLTEKQIECFNRKLHYVREVCNSTDYHSSKPEVIPLIEQASEKIKDKSPPGFSTVSRWIRAYLLANKNPMSLAPSKRNRKNTIPHFSHHIEKTIIKHIQNSYLNKKRITAVTLHELITKELKDEYGIKNIISERTLNRRINKLDPYKVREGRHGKYKAIKEHKAAGQGVISTRILETVEADGNILDVLIVDDETGEVIGRPYGTCLIDTYSRCIFSFVITMTPFSSATLLKALKIGISGDDNNKLGGLFETLITDNGSDYISSSVRNFCNLNGIRIENGAPRDPNSKPHVERVFKTLNNQLIHRLPGSTFSNPKDKGDYDSEKHACLTLDQLKNLISKWLSDYYHRRLHKGHGRVPEILWKESAKDNPITFYPLEYLDTIARDVYQRNISKGRITVHNLQWFSHALATLEQDCKNRGKSTSVDVYVDTLDLGKIFIRDPRNSSVFIQADPVFPDYTNGLSLYEHKLIREKLKEKGKEDKASYDEFYLEIAKWELHEEIDEHRKNYSRKKIARIKETRKRFKERKNNDASTVEKPKQVKTQKETNQDKIVNKFDDNNKKPPIDPESITFKRTS